MNEENSNTQTSSTADKAISIVVTIVVIIGASLLGRFFGFLGIGAIAIGWFVFDRTKEKLGRFFAVCAGAVAGLAAYGFALVAIEIFSTS